MIFTMSIVYLKFFLIFPLFGAFLSLDDDLQLFLCLLCVAVSLLSFVVWFATIEKAEVPPPAGKGMNHRGLKRKREQKSVRPLSLPLGFPSALSFLTPARFLKIHIIIILRFTYADGS